MAKPKKRPLWMKPHPAQNVRATLLSFSEEEGDEPGPIVNFHGLAVTWDFIKSPERDRLPKILIDGMEDMAALAQSAPAEAAPMLQVLIERYPDMLCYSNWLFISYFYLGEFEKATALARHLVEKHPEYLFGHLSLCECLLRDGLVEEAEQVLLKHGRTLPERYPEHDVFHGTEVRGWFFALAKIALAKQDIITATQYRDLLQELEPNSPCLPMLDQQLKMPSFVQSMERGLRALMENMERRKQRKVAKTLVRQKDAGEPDLFG